MDLFPESTNPRALETLAAHAYEGPTYREDREEALEDYRDQRCRGFAECAWNYGDDLNVVDWLEKSAPRQALATVVLATLQGDEELRQTTLRELGDLYIEQRANDYMRQVEDEERRDAEEAAYDRWDARHE